MNWAKIVLFSLLGINLLFGFYEAGQKKSRKIIVVGLLATVISATLIYFAEGRF
jgi:hypothetical protein